jgi:lipid A 4'-phosphatase
VAPGRPAAPWRRVFHTWGWLLLLMAALQLVPQLDLATTAAFYAPVEGFAWQRAAIAEFVRHVLPRLIVASLAVCAVLTALGVARRAPVAGLTPRRLAYLAATMLLGPGLIVETLLKPHWGRARPDEIAAFGGTAAYTPPLWLSDACARNCSFVSGHAAIAFWVGAYAYLLPERYRRIGIAAAMLFGTAVGMVRVAQGAHFLSDVVYAGAIVLAVNGLAARLLLPRPVAP